MAHVEAGPQKYSDKLAPGGADDLLSIKDRPDQLRPRHRFVPFTSESSKSR